MRAIVATLREARPGADRGPAPGARRPPRQRGFDTSLRSYLAAALPDVGAESLEIVHLPVDHLCVACGTRFQAAEIDPACPACGGASLSSMLDEQVEIETT